MKQNNSDISTLVDIIEKKIISKCGEELPDDIIGFLRSEITWLAKKCKKYKLIADFDNQFT